MSRVKVKVKSLEKQVQAVEPAPEPPNPKVKAVKKPKKAKKAKKKVKKPSRGPMGRPSKFTPEVRELIILSIRTGNYIETAAAVAGISKETFYSWMHKGEADDAPKEY